MLIITALLCKTTGYKRSPECTIQLAIQWLVSVLDRSLWTIPGSSLCLLPADELALAGTLLVPSGSCLNLWSLDMKEKTKPYPRKKRLASFTFTSPETIQRKRTLAASPTHPQASPVLLRWSLNPFEIELLRK